MRRRICQNQSACVHLHSSGTRKTGVCFVHKKDPNARNSLAFSIFLAYEFFNFAVVKLFMNRRYCCAEQVNRYVTAFQVLNKFIFTSDRIKQN